MFFFSAPKYVNLLWRTIFKCFICQALQSSVFFGNESVCLRIMLSQGRNEDKLWCPTKAIQGAIQVMQSKQSNPRILSCYPLWQTFMSFFNHFVLLPNITLLCRCIISLAAPLFPSNISSIFAFASCCAFGLGTVWNCEDFCTLPPYSNRVMHSRRTSSSKPSLKWYNDKNGLRQF